MLRALRHLVFVLSLAAIAGLTRDARADTATAQALFDQGKKLMGEKKYAEACPKFEESQKLDPGLGTQTNLAICYESLGRTASAWSLYLEVASQAKATGQPDREKKARDAAKALEPKLSKLTIVVASPAPGLEVKRNGAPVGEATWGTPIPVDPGEMNLTAMAPNRKAWEKNVVVDKPGEQTVNIPELEQGQTPPGYGAGAYQPNPGQTGPGLPYYGQVGPTPQTPRMKRRSTGMMVGGIIAIPVGAITLIAGGITYAVDTSSDIYGYSYGDGSTGVGMMVVGTLLLGGGIALTVIGAKKVPVKDDQSTVIESSPVPEVKLGFGSASAKWTF